MLSRRLLLATSAGAAVASLAGCAVTPPGTLPSPSVTPTPDPGRDALLGVHGALAAALASETDAVRSGLLEWALDVTHEQADAVGAVLPRVPSRTPSVAPSSPPSGVPSAAPTPFPPAALVAALATARTVYQQRASSPATAQPLLWASMGAWCAGLATGLTQPGLRREERRDRLAPPVQTVAEAHQAALTAAEEALYGVQVAGGAPGLTADHGARIRGRVVFWQRLRDDLQRTSAPSAPPGVTADATPGTAPSAPSGPTPAAPWFAVRVPSDAAGAADLVVRVESAALAILGRSLAFGTDTVRVRLVPVLADLAADTPAWGGPIVRWPGWPTS